MMEPSISGFDVVWLDEVDSTNNYLKQLLRRERLEEGITVVADYQTRGRGQRGNGWNSEKGRNLLFSLLVYPRGVFANEQFIISRIASLAVKETLDRFTGDIRIKWPNDIYWKNKKIAGMLIENDLLGKEIKHSIIGVGINVNQQHFSTDLPNPVSLRQITGSEQDRDALLELFLSHFFSLYRTLLEGKTEAIESAYMNGLYRANGFHWYEDKNGRFQAALQTVMPTGHLILRTLEEGEERRYAFKEVACII